MPILTPKRRDVSVAGIRSVALYGAELLDMLSRRKGVLADQMPDEVAEEFLSRLAFYVPQQEVDYVGPDAAGGRLSAVPHLRFAPPSQLTLLGKILQNEFFIDWRINPMDGWEWCRLSSWMDREAVKRAVRSGQASFRRRFADLQAAYRDAPIYIFGTGPSLSTAYRRPWTDGIRVVCNTIVRDRELWHHINPHYIVAGDAIYHFGHNRHSLAFRADLVERLRESPEVQFLYPSLFHGVVIRELQEFSNQLVPVPGGSHKDLFGDLLSNFRLPATGNVLNLLLLPLGSTLGKKLKLLGFDGRSPDAKLFWANSARHSYPEHIEQLKQKHPAFFQHLVPDGNPSKYVASVHGDELDHQLRLAEDRGYSIELLHPSWTGSLHKRYRGDEDVALYTLNNARLAN